MVFVLDKNKKPLMPCTEKRARLLLSRKRAVVHKVSPFTIRLKDRTVTQSVLQPLRCKIDPGSKVTGFAVLRESESDEAEAILLGEVHHKRGIKAKLDNRRSLRRSRRNRKTRYRQPRFNNRRRQEGWLPPSLTARVDQTVNTVNKLIASLPITSVSTEHVKFDTQLMQNQGVCGIEYQQGELAGYEVREYLLEKWGRKCAYCGKKDVFLEVEHILPKSRGGTNRISNLTLACRECNQKKGNQTAEEFGFKEIQKQAQKPLKDTAMMNATRWFLFNRLKNINLPVECGTGARTKKQRIEHNFSKTHYYDACCVGASTPKIIQCKQNYFSVWAVNGRGTRQMCQTDKYGFPKAHRKRKKSHFGFQTGDLVVVSIPKGKYIGRYVGRVSVRANGSFDIKNVTGKYLCQGVSYRYTVVLQRASGWYYSKARVVGELSQRILEPL